MRIGIEIRTLRSVLGEKLPGHNRKELRYLQIDPVTRHGLIKIYQELSGEPGFPYDFCERASMRVQELGFRFVAEGVIRLDYPSNLPKIYS